MESFDIDSLSLLQTHLSELTGLYISLYGDKGNVILPPLKENKLLSLVRSTVRGNAEYDEFIRKSLEKAIRRNDVSLSRGPACQHHFFIPLRIENSILIIVGGGAYLSTGDFEDFYKKEGPFYGLLPYQMMSWFPAVSIREFPSLQDTADRIRSLFRLFLKSSLTSRLGQKRYRLMKIILSLVSEIKFDRQADEMYNLVLDVILFFFNAENASVMIRDGNTFIPKKTSGRLKEYLQSTSVAITGIIAEVVRTHKPLYTESTIEICSLGLGEEITSMHVFPILSDNRVIGIVNILNSVIQQEDADIVMEMCRITGFILRITEMQDVYDKYIREVDVLHSAAARLTPLREPPMLYEAILDTSIAIAGAERGSLMLAEGDTPYLTIKAARGIHKKFLGEIKIKAGEGIAGRVFREGTTLVVDDIEKNELGLKRPKYRTGSFISIPLKIGEKTIGVLNISDKITGEVFSEDDMVLLRSFSSFASIALERSNYYSLAGHLKELSITDSLTGLFNRRYFEERFFEEIHRSKRHNLFFSLAMIDIDDFKLFNDSEGHLAGDEVLRCIANIAKDSLRVIDVIARFGGEEFAVIMPQTDKDEAFFVAERIRKSIREQLPKTWNSFPKEALTISIGLSSFPSDGTERKELIRSADKALYLAKMKGKDKTILWGS
jgi:diguanylate cyclase (GGDEF)-like protein